MAGRRSVGVNGIGIVVVLGGAAFLYSGIKGASLSDTIRGFLAGKLPDGTPFGGVSGPTVGGAGVVEIAKSQLGKPYVWATPASWHTANPPSFDCSGLVGWSYFHAGIKPTLIHQTNSQYAQLRHRALNEAQPGDLIFYRRGIDIYHVGMCIGQGQLIEAPERGVPVRIRDYTPNDKDIMQTVGICPANGITATSAGGGGNPAKNRQLGQFLALSYGWSGAQWSDLDALWKRESGWDNTAENSSSGAYGIAQALPASKYPRAGQKPQSSPQAQILWGLQYIKDRYGNPANAWAHEQANNWY